MAPATLRARLSPLVEGIVILAIIAIAAAEAYRIRLYAITNYGRLIHEFDPWFNARATKYLATHGASKFFKWYDYEAWYPLGRPVGTTIYPGMQFTSVAIWWVLKHPMWHALGLNPKMTLNDVCVFVPAWFGAIATVVLALLTHETTGSWRASAAAALIMAVIPAHTMRSVGGGYDNESVAITAMCLTFYLWCRSLRTPRSWPIGILAGLAYGYMVAAWGGYVFVGNMVGLHAAALFALGHYSLSLVSAYSLWYIVGTSIAIQVPVVGWTPLRSMEQVGPLAVFLGLLFCAIADAFAPAPPAGTSRTALQVATWRARAVAIAALPATVPVVWLARTGYFGPLSVRVRSLFLKHTRTGNPLVDSVAEHQPASREAYQQHLHHALYLAPIGLALLLLIKARGPSYAHAGVVVTKWFIILYAAIAYYFANRMSRLLLLLGPVSSVLAGEAVASGVSWAAEQLSMLPYVMADKSEENGTDSSSSSAPVSATTDAPADAKLAKAKAGASGSGPKTPSKRETRAGGTDGPLAAVNAVWGSVLTNATRTYNAPSARVVRVALAAAIFWFGIGAVQAFWRASDGYAQAVSQPSLIFKAKLRDGREVMVNDYLDAYKWLKKNTPKDSRVMSWWDYGYQINGIAERTTIADGNTWNLEHIAMLGRILTSPEARAHSLARHLADYVLVWAGGGGDDLAKSPHMARIASSVYSDVCGAKDPLCRTFGFSEQGVPAPRMAESMLYKMHSAGVAAGVTVDPSLFQEVYRSQYGMVRIYQIRNFANESKAWLADPANRVCDAPGSWYCVGQYPPALERPPRTHKHIDYDTNQYEEHKQAKKATKAKSK